MELPINQILNGDALTELKKLPNESINCCMTSPPYWALRDYGVKEQLGLEPTFQQYINRLCDIFDEVKRVLRKDGTLWVNIGDTFGTKSGSGFEGDKISKNNSAKGIKKANELRGTFPEMHKSLCNIPARFSIEMQNRGWILRNVIIWHKPNCMPSSVKDRFTVDFEYLFFFVKNKKYFFETQYEPNLSNCDSRLGQGRSEYKGKFSGDSKAESFNSPRARTQRPGYNAFVTINSQGRNKRAVWSITTKPFKEAHFATYPESLCETPIKAGCPEFVCNKCGKARERKEKVIGKQISQAMKTAGSDKEGKYYGKEQKDYDSANANNPSETKKRILESMSQVKEYSFSDCGCNAGFSGGIVLDPFFGAGTTGLVALKQKKKFIGIELNQDYIKIAENRLKPYLEQQTL